LALAHQLDELVKSDFLKDYLQEQQNDQALMTAGADQGHEVPYMVRSTPYQKEDVLSHNGRSTHER